jgi:hypothetical protein
MKITYAVTVCNEFLEIQRLLNFLLKINDQKMVLLYYMIQRMAIQKLNHFYGLSLLINHLLGIKLNSKAILLIGKTI